MTTSSTVDPTTDAHAQAVSVVTGVSDATAQPTPDKVDSGRLNLESIDLLRGAAAIWVTLYHALGFFWRTGHRPIAFGTWQQSVASVFELTLGQGWLGVPLFFVLSGFCIHLPYARRDRLNVREYSIRRFIRIWIPFAACAPLGMAMTYAHTHDLPDVLRVGIFHLFFWIWDLHPLAQGETILGGFGAVWTVVVEVQLYVLYAVLWPTIRKFGLPRVTLAFLIIGLAYHIGGEVVRHHATIPNFFLPRSFAVARFGEWLLGAWIADAIVKRRIPPMHVARAVGIVVAGAALVAVMRWASVVTGLDMYTLEPIQSAGFAAIVLGAVLIEQQTAQRAAHDVDRRGLGASLLRVGATVGRRCYSLYLFHFVFLAIVGELAVRAMGLSDADKDALGGTPRWFFVTAAALVVIAVVTEVAYRLIELPSHRLARRLATTGRDTATV